MKTISAALQRHHEQECQTTATCLKIKTTNNLITLGFTDLDNDLNFDVGDGDGTILYKALFGYDRSNIESKVELSVDNVEANFILDDVALSAEDFRAGVYDDAEIKMFTLNYEDLTMGHMKLRRGNLGEIRLIDSDIGIAEVRGMFQRLTQNLLPLYSPDCRVDLGSNPGCLVKLNPSLWTPSTVVTVRVIQEAGSGSVVRPTLFNDRHFKCTTAGTTGATEPSWNLTLGGTTADNDAVWTTIQALTIETTVNVVTSKREFTINYTGDAPGDTVPVSKGGTGNLLNEGRATWIGGPNRGDVEEVKEWDLSAKKIKLFLTMPKDITSGDVIEITAGCNKLFSICKATFDNVNNFRGQHKVPGQNLVLNFPNAT